MRKTLIAGKSLHMPAWLSNPYQLMLARGLQNSGWEVIFDSYPEHLQAVSAAAAQHPDVDVIHLHWTDPYFEKFLWVKGSLRFRMKAILMRVDLMRARRFVKRIVWTVHNEVSHESKNPKREVLLNKILAVSVDNLIFHSESALLKFEASVGIKITDKSVVVPHGNYMGWYPENGEIAKNYERQFHLSQDSIVLLIFGGIRHYKGIPKIVRNFSRTENNHLRLIIAGPPFDQDLIEEIATLAARDERIYLLADFIPDENVAPLLSISHAMIMAFERTLTSGSALLAMSFGLPLIMPDLAKVFDLVDENGAWYYTEEQELASIIETFNRDIARQKGRWNRRTAEQLNWDDIGANISKLYD